jgi:ATP-dependent protease ClpP protease subunit
MPAPITLAFDGIIGEAPNDAASVRAALRTGGPVQVSINSFGGIATEGMAIYSILKAHPARVDVVVDSVAASAASLIAMAGDHIEMRAGSLLMIHDPAAVAIGPASVMESTRAVLEKMANEYASIYAARSGKSPEEIRALMLAETWLTGPESVEAGLADVASSERATATAHIFDNDNFRFHNMPASIAALATLRKPDMPTPNPAPTDPAPAPPVNLAANITDILARCTKAKLSLDQANDIVVKSAGNVEMAKDLITDALIASVPGRRDNYVPGDVTLENPATLHAAVRDVLVARMTGKPVKADTPAAALVGKPLLDLGAMIVEANGGKIRSWHRDRLAEQVFAPTMAGGQHGTSDFPGLTLDAGNRVLLDAYATAQSPLKQIARRRSAQDFRALSVLRLGEAPALLEVPESGEVTFGTRAEAKESFSLRTFARIFSISRQAVINDDLAAFGDAARAWGVAAANVEADVLYDLISGNGVELEDDVSLWNATHGNVAGSAAALDVDGLSDARKALRDTKGLDGVTPLNLVPKFLLVGSANETQGEKTLATLAAATVDDANPFSGKLTLLVEPRISDYAWFVFADPLQAEVLSYANLGDATGPQLATRDGWTVLGQEFRAVDDFGAGATGYRGAFKNAGAAPS